MPWKSQWNPSRGWTLASRSVVQRCPTPTSANTWLPHPASASVPGGVLQPAWRRSAAPAPARGPQAGVPGNQERRQVNTRKGQWQWSWAPHSSLRNERDGSSCPCCRGTDFNLGRLRGREWCKEKNHNQLKWHATRREGKWLRKTYSARQSSTKWF